MHVSHTIHCWAFAVHQVPYINYRFLFPCSHLRCLCNKSQNRNGKLVIIFWLDCCSGLLVEFAFGDLCNKGVSEWMSCTLCLYVTQTILVSKMALVVYFCRIIKIRISLLKVSVVLAGRGCFPSIAPSLFAKRKILACDQIFL